MLKKISILSIVMVALMGCARTELVNTEREITFAVGSYATATKAASIIDVDNVTSFNTKAWLYAEGVVGSQDFFGTDGETITYNNTDAWEPSHPYYWPKSSNSYINFVSWYDNSDSYAPTTVSETALEWVNRTIDANDNIMFADVAWRYNNNASTYNFNGVVNGVPTLFHHALTRVQFNLKATTLQQDGKTYELTLQSVTLASVYNRGTMRLTNSDLNATGTKAWTSTSNATYLWTAIAGSNADTYSPVTTDTNITATNTAIMPLRSFMPQALGNDIKLTFTYTLTTRSGNSIVSSEDGIVTTVVLNTVKNSSNVEITEWLPNRKYIYNFAINPQGQDILLDPVLESDWGVTDLSATVE